MTQESESLWPAINAKPNGVERVSLLFQNTPTERRKALANSEHSSGAPALYIALIRHNGSSKGNIFIDNGADLIATLTYIVQKEKKFGVSNKDWLALRGLVLTLIKRRTPVEPSIISLAVNYYNAHPMTPELIILDNPSRPPRVRQDTPAEAAKGDDSIR